MVDCNSYKSSDSPFGMVMPGRNWKAATANEYEFGFNGQLNNNEIISPKSVTTAMFWEYDCRIARRWNLDPKPHFSHSAYSTYMGNPILFSDILGDTIRIYYNDDYGIEQSFKYVPGMSADSDNSFANKTIQDLNKLYEGNAGKEMLNSLNKNKKDINIRENTDPTNPGSHTIGLNVYFDPNSNLSGIDVNGNNTTESFITLGHELAHAWDLAYAWTDGQGKSLTDLYFGVGMYEEWYNTGSESIAQAEKFSTHMENRFRAEHNLPLRKYYSITNTNGIMTGDGQLIIGTTSIYFKVMSEFKIEKPGYSFWDDSPSKSAPKIYIFSEGFKYK